ncbi:hypothetical protein [Rossellomorea marisflavi]|uniref:hypothetical protein n=1 Tax=Rossellomorea marisflavi TaxID=189381 RepID=UPI00064EE0C5|nr:hypothetical protein [Rossellomorea marisflavi]KMK93721.1 hypothetical protein VL03_12690 [Rossellomorea marisflavi]
MNEISITYLDDMQTDYLVAWPGGKRKFRYTMPHKDFNAIQFSLLTLVYEQTLEETDRKALSKMNSVKVFKLVERFATEFCYAHSPKSGCGLEKRFIRQVILQALHEVQGAR